MDYLNRAEIVSSLGRLKKSQSVCLSIYPLGRYESFKEFMFSCTCDVNSAIYIITRCYVDSLFTFKEL